MIDDCNNEEEKGKNGWRIDKNEKNRYIHNQHSLFFLHLHS